MSSPRPQQQSALVRYDIGLHEAYHCAYAASRGVQVLAVDVLAGYSDLTLPFAPSGMCQAFRDPEWASGQLVVIIGVLAAEAFAAQKQWPGRYYNRAVWADVQQYEAYQSSYSALPPRLVDYNRVLHTKAPWEALGAAARAAVRAWYVRPGVPQALLSLASQLAEAGVVEARGWQRLWASAAARPLRVAAGQRKYWVTHPADSPNGTCKECEAIAAENADGVGEGEGFATGIPGDTIAGPPAHKHCRCTVEVR